MPTIDPTELKPSKLASMGLRDLNQAYEALTGEKGKFRSKDEAVQRIQSKRRMLARTQTAGDGTLRSFAETLLKRPLAYSQVLEEVRAKFPDCRTSRSSLRWYASQMRRRGEDLPERPLDV